MITSWKGGGINDSWWVTTFRKTGSISRAIQHGMGRLLGKVTVYGTILSCVRWVSEEVAGLSIRPDDTRNGEVFLISFPDQRNGSRAFISSVCHLLHISLLHSLRVSACRLTAVCRYKTAAKVSARLCRDLICKEYHHEHETN
jgi:hypothetical protein